MAKGKYQNWLTEDGLLRIQGWARDGLTNEDIAFNMGITAKTLYEWMLKYSELSEALKEGKDVIDRRVENALANKALSGDVTAMIFWLKNRKPKEWRDRFQQDIYTPEPIKVETLSNIPKEDLKALRDILKKNEK
jgi:hypothetical protein